MGILLSKRKISNEINYLTSSIRLKNIVINTDIMNHFNLGKENLSIEIAIKGDVLIDSGAISIN